MASPIVLALRLVRRLSLTLSLTLLAACGLISSDIATVKFNLPERTYSFDTAKSGWNLPPATLPTLPCADDTTCQAAASTVGVDPGMVFCDPGSSSCALTVTVETPPQTINLKMDAQGLGSLNSQSAIDVTVSQIKYDVGKNTMNVDLPPVELFVAPNGVTSTSDPQAKRFGTVPSTPSGQTIMDGAVTMDPVGQQAFVGFAHNFGTPFVFIARSVVVVPGGSPLPMGAVDITVKGQLSAKPRSF
jgi:hypothetical protein